MPRAGPFERRHGSVLIAAGSKEEPAAPVRCCPRPAAIEGGTLPSKVSVPVSIAPVSGRRATRFAVTWATGPAPAGMVYDVQVKRPGSAAFTTSQNGVTQPSAGFKVTKTGSCAFEARVRKSAGSGGTGFSTPATIHVR